MEQDFLENVKESSADFEIVQQAFNFAKNAHNGQKRIGGEDFFSHPVNVANILLVHNQKIDYDTSMLAAALLHDTVEDTKVELTDIKENFSPEITKLVDALTKIEHSEDVQINHELTYQKVLKEGEKDKRVFFIKLADLLHNLQTVNVLPEKRRKRIAKEALDFYLPIAKKLNLNIFAEELEALAIRQL